MKSKIVRWWGLAVVVVIVFVVAYRFLRPNPLIGEAKGMVIAMRDGDGDRLYDSAISDERGCSDLTPAQLHTVWQILIQPLIANSRFVGEDPIELETNRTQAVGAFRYVTKQGDPWALNAIANQSDEGAKTNVVYSMVATASLFDENGHANPTLTSDLALAGVRRVCARLEAVGIHKLMLAPGTCFTWDQIERKLTH